MGEQIYGKGLPGICRVRPASINIKNGEIHLPVNDVDRP
jgi:hypothetical protein